MVPTRILIVLFISMLVDGTLQWQQRASEPTAPRANTSYGVLEGFTDVVDGKTIAKFFGIPFAKAPVGSLRFQAPMDPVNWLGVKKATEFGKSCLQRYINFPGGDDIGPQDEDCLYLNVYSPQINSQGPLPVMVWIHGGAYYIGAARQYDATNLATKDVVLVTINYRLDVMGFFSTGDAEAPGNYGLLDQIAALKWVKDNIQNFGGDPSKVTIFGESAGSSSVSLLVLSQLAKGLFQNAIMESGSALNPWALQHPNLRVSAYMMSRLIGNSVRCPDLADTSKLVSCLRGINAQMLHNATVEISYTLDAGIVMSPRVETNFGVIPDLPINLLAQGKVNQVNTIRGFTADEMGGIYEQLFKKYSNFSMEVFRSEVVGQTFKPFATVDLNEISSKLEGIYISSNKTSAAILAAIINASNDLTFNLGVIIETGMMAAAAPSKNHYLYIFDKKSENNKTPSWISAVHGDDLYFVFGLNLNLPSKAGVAKLMMDLWTEFAKTGTANSQLLPSGESWKPYSRSSPNFLKINDTPRLLQYTDLERLKTYSEILRRVVTAKHPSDAIIG